MRAFVSQYSKTRAPKTAITFNIPEFRVVSFQVPSFYTRNVDGLEEFLQMEFLQVVILTKLFLQEENLQRVIFP